MLEVKNNKLIIDGTVKDLNNLNIINSKGNSIYFSNNILERIKEFPYTIDQVYNALIDAGLQYFWFVNNTIINVNNIEKVYIKYYQYAGLSILESSKLNADVCFMNLQCKNGKTESIAFSSHKEAEKMYHELDNKLADLKSKEVYYN